MQLDLQTEVMHCSTSRFQSYVYRGAPFLCCSEVSRFFRIPLAAPITVYITSTRLDWTSKKFQFRFSTHSLTSHYKRMGLFGKLRSEGPMYLEAEGFLLNYFDIQHEGDVDEIRYSYITIHRDRSVPYKKPPGIFARMFVSRKSAC